VLIENFHRFFVDKWQVVAVDVEKDFEVMNDDSRFLHCCILVAFANIQATNSGGGFRRRDSSSVRTAEMKKGTLHVFRELDKNRFF
jgi:hypothetical protein